MAKRCTDNPYFYSQFAIRFRELINASDKSYAQLSREMGIPRSSIYQYCVGRHRPRMRYLLKIADYFGVTYEYMHGGEAEYERKEKNKIRDRRV